MPAFHIDGTPRSLMQHAIDGNFERTVGLNEQLVLADFLFETVKLLYRAKAS